MNTEKEIGVGINQSDFEYESLEQLLDDHENLKPGNVIYLAELVKPELSQIFQADEIIELLAKNAWDIAGKDARGWPETDMKSDEPIKELEALIHGWINKYCPVWFRVQQNVRKYVMKDADFEGR